MHNLADTASVESNTSLFNSLLTPPQTNNDIMANNDRQSRPQNNEMLLDNCVELTTREAEEPESGEIIIVWNEDGAENIKILLIKHKSTYVWR